MEKECTKCHRIYQTLQEETSLCPDCLKHEFGSATPLNDAEHEALVSEYKWADRRQRQRAERMNENYLYKNRFSVAGKLRFSFGMVLFAITLFFYVVISGDSFVTSADAMNDASMRGISVLLCTIAAVLVGFSSPRHRWLTYTLGVAIIIAGWYMPDWREMSIDAAVAAENAAEEREQEKGGADLATVLEGSNGRVLSKSDLEVFYQLKANSTPSVSQYAVYMTGQDARTREIVRESLTRLLEAEYTRAYTRSSGALYVIANVPGRQKNISHILSRYGKVVYSNPVEGVYEMRFDSEKANLVSRYPVEVLTSPSNASFVSANISELTSLDPLRVRAAALAFRNANVKVLRREVHEALLRVLQDPWAQDYDTYSALVSALVIYSAPGDKAVTGICRSYFEAQRVARKDIPQQVTEYLVAETPDEMVEPILGFWLDNPLAWNNIIGRLGVRVQKPMLEKLKNHENMGQANAILKFLKDYGNAEAIPAVQEFAAKAQSNLLQRSAEDTLKALRSR